MIVGNRHSPPHSPDKSPRTALVQTAALSGSVREPRFWPDLRSCSSCRGIASQPLLPSLGVSPKLPVGSRSSPSHSFSASVESVCRMRATVLPAVFRCTVAAVRRCVGLHPRGVDGHRPQLSHSQIPSHFHHLREDVVECLQDAVAETDSASSDPGLSSPANNRNPGSSRIRCSIPPRRASPPARRRITKPSRATAADSRVDPVRNSQPRTVAGLAVPPVRVRKPLSVLLPTPPASLGGSSKPDLDYRRRIGSPFLVASSVQRVTWFSHRLVKEW